MNGRKCIGWGGDSRGPAREESGRKRKPGQGKRKKKQEREEKGRGGWARQGDVR